MKTPKTKAPQSLLSLMSWAITIGILLVGVILVLALSPPANANECEHKHGCKTTTTVVVNKEDSDEWKYVLGTAIVTCAAISIYRQTWCWEKGKPEPVPNPGPVPKNDVTPDPVGVRLYQ